MLNRLIILYKVKCKLKINVVYLDVGLLVMIVIKYWKIVL